MQWPGYDGGWDDSGWEDGPWNNKWRPSGSGTVSHARKQRIQAAAQERDRLAALGDSAALADKAKKEAQKAASMRKQAEEAAEQAAKTAAAAAAAAEAAAASSHGWVEVGPSRKKPRKGTPKEPPCQKEQQRKKNPPCQKEQQKKKDTPCQKEQHKKKDTPCQKEQNKKKGTPCQKEQDKKKDTPCQKEQDKKKGTPCQKEQNKKKDTPCQKEQDKKEDTPCQKEQKETTSAPSSGSKDGKGGAQELGPSEKQKVKEEKKAKKDSLPKGTVDGGMDVDWGNSSSSSSSSASSGTPSPGSPDPLTKGGNKKDLPKKQPPKRVAVDWHKVLVHDDLYDLRCTPWLQKLKDAGYEVHLLSYCGWKRSQEVYEWAWFEWDGWASVNFTWKQCGKDGKAQWCLDHGVSKLVDDNIDICTEATKFGIQAYPIVPAGQRRRKGQPKLQSCFSDFPAAAIDILQESP